jgi:hypothetical protein
MRACRNESRRAYGPSSREHIEPFKQLYERFKNSRLPARAVLIDALKDLSVPEDFLEEGVDTFIVNLRFVGLLQTLSGAGRIITIDHLLDSVPATTSAPPTGAFAGPVPEGFALKPSPCPSCSVIRLNMLNLFFYSVSR